MKSAPGDSLRRLLRYSLVASFLLAPCLSAQDIHFNTGDPTTSAHGQRVSLQTDAFTVQAGKSGWIELRFHVAPGFHINSHMPGDETLIPTDLRLETSPAGRLLRTEFPAGTPYHLEIGQGETLSTYGKDFAVRLQLKVAEKGQTTLSGTLHYQACDNASCFPARDLPVRLALTAR